MGMAGNMGGTQNPQSTQSSMQSPATGGKGGGMPMQTQSNYSTQASPMGGKGGGYSAPSKYTTQPTGQPTAQPTAAPRPPSQEFIYTPTNKAYEQGPVGANIYEYNMSKLAQRLDPSASLPSTQRTYTPLPPPPPPPSYGGTAPDFFNGITGGKGGALGTSNLVTEESPYNTENPFTGQKPIVPRSVQELYQTYLDRDPEQAGMEYWNSRFGDSIDLREANEFIRAANEERLSRGMGRANRLDPRYSDVGGVSYGPSNTLRDTGEQEYDLPEPYQEFLGGATMGNAPAPGSGSVPGQTMTYRNGVYGYYRPATEQEIMQNSRPALFGGVNVYRTPNYDPTKKAVFVPYSG